MAEQETRLKSIIIQVRGDKLSTNIKLISLHGFNITSPAELGLIQVLYELYGHNTFMMNEGVKGQIKGKIPAISEGSLKVMVSRLISANVIVKTGKLLGLNVAFKDVDKIDQVVLRLL